MTNKLTTRETSAFGLSTPLFRQRKRARCRSEREFRITVIRERRILDRARRAKKGDFILAPCLSPVHSLGTLAVAAIVRVAVLPMAYESPYSAVCMYRVVVRYGHRHTTTGGANRGSLSPPLSLHRRYDTTTVTVKYRYR